MTLLRANPQDLPYSPLMAVLCICGFSLVSFLTASAQAMNHGKAMFAAGVDTLIIVGFGLAVLWIKDLPRRRVQTLSALAGTGVILKTLLLPMKAYLVQLGQTASAMGNLIALFIILISVWEIVIIGHIVRHSLDISLPFGAGIAVLYAIFSIKVAFFIAAT